jgi:hypothetical protein
MTSQTQQRGQSHRNPRSTSYPPILHPSRISHPMHGSVQLPGVYHPSASFCWRRRVTRSGHLFVRGLDCYTNRLSSVIVRPVQETTRLPVQTVNKRMFESAPRFFSNSMRPPKEWIRVPHRVRGYNPQVSTLRTCVSGVVLGPS